MIIQFSRGNVSQERAAELKAELRVHKNRCPHSDEAFAIHHILARLMGCEGYDYKRCHEGHLLNFDYILTSRTSKEYFDRLAVHESRHENHRHTPANSVSIALSRFVDRGVTRLIVVTDTPEAHASWVRQGRDFNILVEPRTYRQIYSWIDSLVDGDRLQQQLLAEITHDLSRKIVEMIAFDERNLARVEWRDLERALAECFWRVGFQAELTPPAKDGGKDLIIRALHKGAYLYFHVELKHWVSGKRVGKEVVEQFLKVNVRDRVDGGLFVSTSGYGKNVFNMISHFRSDNVVLSGQSEITQLCRSYVKTDKGIWACPRDFINTLWIKTVDSTTHAR